MGVIYKITNPIGRIYIGKTWNFRKRLVSHRYSVKKKSPHVILINSFRKYGFDEHIFEIIEECENEIMDEREMYWIKFFDSFNGDNPLGMNMTLGGDGQKGYYGFDERRKQAMYNNLLGKGHPFTGKQHTEATKKLLSEIISKKNKESGRKVPQWGAEKGWAKVRKEIVAYGNDGNFIKEYKSLVQAANELRIERTRISESILYNQWAWGKYKFFYKTGEYPLTIPINDINLKQESKSVVVFNKNMEFLGKYENAELASNEINVPITTIRRAAAYNNGRPIRKGFIFYYEEDYIKKVPLCGEGDIALKQPK